MESVFVVNCFIINYFKILRFKVKLFLLYIIILKFRNLYGVQLGSFVLYGVGRGYNVFMYLFGRQGLVQRIQSVFLIQYNVLVEIFKLWGLLRVVYQNSYIVIFLYKQCWGFQVFCLGVKGFKSFLREREEKGVIMLLKVKFRNFYILIFVMFYWFDSYKIYLEFQEGYVNFIFFLWGQNVQIMNIIIIEIIVDLNVVKVGDRMLREGVNLNGSIRVGGFLFLQDKLL